MNTYQSIFRKFEHGFFGSVALGILLSSCIGGIAAMAVLQNGTDPIQFMQLILGVAAAMLFNGAVLSQQSPKTVFHTLIISVGMNSLLILFNNIKYYG